MTARLHPITRVLLALGVLAMPICYFVPLWQIQLWAPQYPEGLNMKIWINKLSGAFEIINGLNHYIGMALIKEEMFPEFKFMIYVLGAMIVLGLLPVLIGTRKWLWVYVVFLAIGGLAGLCDFYRWGYNYGHNLDPHAAISVPGMSYQPPLIGYKNLLNFTAFSGPDIGGWILIVSGTVAGLLLGWEQFIRNRRRGAAGKLNLAAVTGARLVLAATLTLSAMACDAAPEPIRYGQDECAECKMMISDRRFGAEVISRKGRVFKFDDVRCLRSFEKRAAIPGNDIKARLVTDFQKPDHFISVEEACFVTHDRLKSPMGGDTAAFQTAEEAGKVRKDLGAGVEIRWADLEKKL